jgi:hypothetical protein
MDKIYVRFIDGTNSWVPINAREKSNNLYELLDDQEYNDLDSTELFEFYPGDIVEVEDSEDLDNEYQYVAKQLVSASRRPDRDYLVFKFYSTFRHLPINELTAKKYTAVIQRIKREKTEGKFFYKGILETVERLDKLIKS